MVDAVDSKSTSSNRVLVRVRSSAIQALLKRSAFFLEKIMIIYGIKNIPLKTLEFPVPCLSCGNEKQGIEVYCTCFSLFYIPFLPYRKRALLYCEACGKTQKMRDFFKKVSSKKEAKSHFKSILKKIRVPFYLFATTGTAMALIGAAAYLSYTSQKQISIQAGSYSRKPISNALVVIKVEDDVYPYQIAYVPEVDNKEAIVFVWKYSYERKGDARKALSTVLNSLSTNTVEANFSEPYVVLLKDFSNLDFVYVEQLEKEFDW